MGTHTFSARAFSVTRASRKRCASPLFRLLAAGLFLVLLGGCSLLRFGYGHIDTYAMWMANEYFDLDPKQAQDFRARFGRLHEWHRTEQLPDYAAFLDGIRGRVENGLTREDWVWITDGVRSRYRALIERSADDMAALLLTVAPHQLEALQRRWDRDNSRFVRDYRLKGGAEERRRAGAERALERIREWTGGLGPEQEAKIAALTAVLPMDHRLRHQDRLRRQREFLDLMAERGDPARFAARLKQWLLDWEKGRAPEYEKLWARWSQEQPDFYVAVDRMLTPQQREYATRRLRRYSEDFRRLAQRPAERTAAMP
jgi:hypothetical protein